MEGMWDLCPIITRMHFNKDAETEHCCHLGTKWEVYFESESDMNVTLTFHFVNCVGSLPKNTVYGEKVVPYIVDDISVPFPLMDPKNM